MNIDVFQDEVAPVWYDPARTPPAADQTAPQKRDLYRTQFHQTYGLPVTDPLHRTIYGLVVDEGHTLSPIPLDRVRPDMLRQEVSYQTVEAPARSSSTPGRTTSIWSSPVARRSATGSAWAATAMPGRAGA